jgi:hypothetical protein
MRTFATLVGSAARLHAVAVPGARPVDFNRRPRRRLDDSLVDIFERASASNNLDAAADILTILEKWHDRRKSKYGRERRIGDVELTAMRGGLNRLMALRTS